MKNKLLYSVIFIETAEYGQFEITTDVTKYVKDYITLIIKHSDYDKEYYQKELEKFDSNSENFIKRYIYYQKNFTTLKAAEKHIEFLKTKLDDHIAPTYNVNYSGFRDYLESINYWKD